MGAAATIGRTDIVQMLLDLGAAAGPKNNDGRTLMPAAVNGHTDLAQMLVNVGATVP